MLFTSPEKRHDENLVYCNERRINGINKIVVKKCLHLTKFDFSAENEHGIKKGTLYMRRTKLRTMKGIEGPGESRSTLPPNGVHKRMSINLQGHSSNQLKQYVKMLNANIEYDGAGPDMQGFSGTFKLSNDPRADQITYENMLFAGSKSYTAWCYGIVIFGGTNTKIMQRNIQKTLLS